MSDSSNWCNLCVIESCHNSRDYELGNSRFFCNEHKNLVNKYTRIELEYMEIKKNKY